MWVARGCVKRGGCIRVFKVQLAIGLGNLNKKISLGVCVRVCAVFLFRSIVYPPPMLARLVPHSTLDHMYALSGPIPNNLWAYTSRKAGARAITTVL